MTKQQVVYLLREKGTSNLKIGISIDPIVRLRTIPEQIDIEESFYIECPRASMARKIELVLHTLFASHRIEKQPGDGHTEWFSPNCFEEVKTFIGEQSRRLGWGDLKPLSVLRPRLPVLESEGKAVIETTSKSRDEDLVRREFEQRTREHAAEAIHQYCVDLRKFIGESGCLGRVSFRVCTTQNDRAPELDDEAALSVLRERREYLLFDQAGAVDYWIDNLDVRSLSVENDGFSFRVDPSWVVFINHTPDGKLIECLSISRPEFIHQFAFLDEINNVIDSASPIHQRGLLQHLQPAVISNVRMRFHVFSATPVSLFGRRSFCEVAQ
jgi:hypothetical protein